MNALNVTTIAPDRFMIIKPLVDYINWIKFKCLNKYTWLRGNFLGNWLQFTPLRRRSLTSKDGGLCIDHLLLELSLDISSFAAKCNERSKRSSCLKSKVIRTLISSFCRWARLITHLDTQKIFFIFLFLIIFLPRIAVVNFINIVIFRFIWQP